MMNHRQVYSLRQGVLTLALGLFSTLSTTVSAAVLTWGLNGSGLGGTGTWDTAAPNWRNGSSTVTWSTTTDTAMFAGSTAGIVTIGTGGIMASDLLFNTSGYTLVGPSTLSLLAANPNITLANSVTAIISNPLAITSTVGNGRCTISGGTSSVLTLSGPLSGTSTGSYMFIISGGVTVNLSGSNSFNRGTLLRGCTLNLNQNYALGASGLTTQNTTNYLNNISGAAVTLATTAAHSFQADVTFIGNNNLNLGTGNVSLSGTTRTITVNNNKFTLGGVISSSTTNLIKAGAGTLEFTNTNTYSGSTIINGGTLLVSGSGTVNTSAAILVDGLNAVFKYTSTRALTKDVAFGAAGGGSFIYDSTTAYARAMTVASGGTLSGTGVFTGPVTIASGGFLSPGNSPGIISTGTLAVNGSLKAEVNGTVAGTNYDQVLVTGSVALNNVTSNLNFILGYAPTVGNSYTIINNDGAADAVAGTFATVTTGTSTRGFLSGNMFDADYNSTTYRFQVDYVGGDGNDVVVTFVPEPAALALLGLGGLALLRRRRGEAV